MVQGKSGTQSMSPPCMDVMQKADVINFPLHSSFGLHIRGPLMLKDGRTASRWSISVDRTGGFALSDGLSSSPPPPLLCPPIFAVLSLFSLCRQLLITPHWGVGHAWVSFGPPPPVLSCSYLISPAQGTGMSCQQQ